MHHRTIGVSGMPFNHYIVRRNRIPWARYRVRNWRKYGV